MNSTVVFHSVWAVVAVAAFSAGYLVSQPSGDSQQLSSKLFADSISRADGTAILAHNPDENSSTAFEPLNSQAVRGRTFEILTGSNRVARMRQFCELLEGITRDTWREAVDAFMRQTTVEFRLNPEEWNLLSERVGEVAGAEAIAEAMVSDKRNDKERVRLLMMGWAAADPKAADAWVKSQPPEVQQKLLDPLLSGMARTDPKLALTLAIAYPQEVQEGIIPNIVDAAVQRGGFREAEALLAPLLGRADIEDGTRGKVFSKLAHRRIAVGKVTEDPFEALAWFDGYLGPDSPAGPTATGQLMANAAFKDPQAAMNWLQERVDRMSAYQADIMFPVAAQEWSRKAPAQFIAWMEANPGHPYRDNMVPFMVSSLLGLKKVDDAHALIASIREPKIRVRAEKLLLQFESGNKRGPQ